MKVIAIAFAFLLAGVTALPKKYTNELEAAIRAGEPRLVTGNIVAAIEDAAQSIRDAGLDPLDIAPRALEYALPVPTVFNARAHHGGIHSHGLSNIVINRMNYAVITSRLTFNIELPEIVLAVESSEVDINILGKNLNSRTSGSIAVKNIVIAGDIRVSVGVITGISIRSMELEFLLGGIDSNINLSLQNVDVSAPLNNYLGVTIPETLRAYESDINELLTIIGRQVVEANL